MARCRVVLLVYVHMAPSSACQPAPATEDPSCYQSLSFTAQTPFVVVAYSSPEPVQARFCYKALVCRRALPAPPVSQRRLLPVDVRITFASIIPVDLPPDGCPSDSLSTALSLEPGLAQHLRWLGVDMCARSTASLPVARLLHAVLD